MKYLVFEDCTIERLNPSYTLMIFECSFMNVVLTELIVNSDIITNSSNSWGTVIFICTTNEPF